MRKRKKREEEAMAENVKELQAAKCTQKWALMSAFSI
jgi:hypothetical protein